MNHKGALKIRQMVSNFWASRILLTANNFRLFDYLEKPTSVKELSNKLKFDSRATELLLNALIALKLLRKRDNEYKNTAYASKYLVSGRPYYQGDILKHHDILWRKWSELDEIIKRGKPNRSFYDHRSFILGMHNIASLRCKDIMKNVDLRGVHRILDLGGGPGTYSLSFAKKGKVVTLFDTSETISIAKGVIKRAGLDGKVRFIEGDFMVDPIGSGYDLVFMSQILHMFSEKENIKLLGKAKRSLNPDGRVIIHEFYLRNNKTEPLPGALFSINMLVNTSSGRAYSVNEISEWLKRVGLKLKNKQRLDEAVLIQAQK